MTFQIATEQEADGRWLAEVDVLPGVMAYGTTRTDAVAKVQALALRVLADRMDQGEAVPELLNVSFQAATSRLPKASANLSNWSITPLGT